MPVYVYTHTQSLNRDNATEAVTSPPPTGWLAEPHSLLSSPQPQMVWWYSEAVQRGLCTSTSAWLLWIGKTQEEGKMGLEITLSIRVFCFAICVCLRVCMWAWACVRLCVGVWVCQGGGDIFITASSSSFAFTGETRLPDLFCFLPEKEGWQDGREILSQFFHRGSHSHTHLCNSWNANGESWRVGQRMAHYKDVSVRKTSINLVTGFFQYLRGK